MPSRRDLPGRLPRNKFLNSLRRLGFYINTVGGKGDHVKIIWPPTQESVTVVGDLRKDVLYLAVYFALAEPFCRAGKAIAPGLQEQIN